MSQVILQLEKIAKKYGEKEVLQDISFQIRKGDMIGYLGANGAGKSTSIRMMTGLEKADAGKIFFEGREITGQDRVYQRSIGVVPQELAVYQDMSGYDNVKFFCSLYGYDKNEVKRRTKEALEFVGLWENRKEKAGKYSGGMKRRLNIACAITHSPKLLIMDEPTVGIDPQSRNHIMEAIRKLHDRGTVVLYVSHYMEEIEALCNRIVLVEKGKILKDCTKEALKEEYAKESLYTLEDIFLSITGKQLRDEVGA